MVAPDPTDAAPSTPDPVDLATVLSEIARTLEPEPDVERMVSNIVAAAAATVPSADQAGVSLLERGEMRSVAPSSDVVAKLDRLQHDIGEGPCVDAVFTRPIYRTGDIANDRRWPRFGTAAAGAGVASMLAFRLFTSTTVVGALNLYSAKPDAFDEEAERVGELFAAHAAVALAGSRGQAQLHSALQTRDVIGMAKGILMQRHGLTPDQTFEMLVEASQHANVKLRDAAEWLVGETARLDPS